MPANIHHWGILRFDAGMMLLFYAPQVFRQRLYLGTGYKLQGETHKGLALGPSVRPEGQTPRPGVDVTNSR